MINVAPSDQLKNASHFFVAWLLVAALLVGLATVSGKTGVSIAIGIFFSAILIMTRAGAFDSQGGGNNP